VTGTGKTHIGVAAIREHAKAGGRALVLVPAVALLRQWQAELERYVPEGRVGVLGDGESSTLHGYDVVVSTVQTARGHPRILPPGIEGLLVADECHRYAGEEFRRALRETFAARLGLSATLARPDGAHDTVLMPYFEQVVFTLDYRRALSDGIIAQVEVAFVCVPFSAGETSRYEEHSAKMHAARSRLVHTYGLTPEPFGAFLAEVTRLQQDFGSPGQREASTYLRSWTGRRDLLANTDAKLRLLPKLAPAIQRSDRSILFTQRTRSADRIVAELRSLGVDAAAHHSEISGDDKRRALDDFAEGRLKAIVAVDTLTEGIDVPQADLEIVMAASQQRRQMIQRMGRVLRPKADGRAARFAIVSVAGTCEDPALGAYEQFLEDLLDIASAEGHFDGATPVRTISDFLSPREQGDDGVIRS
jgi:superfamily II DNA or RNA helicase